MTNLICPSDLSLGLFYFHFVKHKTCDENRSHLPLGIVISSTLALRGMPLRAVELMTDEGWNDRVQRAAIGQERPKTVAYRRRRRLTESIGSYAFSDSVEPK